MHSRKSRSRQELIQQRRQSIFVGREQQLQQFRYNLSLPAQDWCFLFNIWGQGGVGKSTLTRQFRKLAEQTGFLTAGIDEGCTSAPDAMGRLAEQLEQQGQKLDKFQERYKVYRQKKQELESDPEAPQGLSAFVGRTVAKAGLGLAKQIPGSGAVTPFLDDEVITTQASEWATFVTKRLTNKDEVRLVQEPVEVLTPLFLQGLSELASHKNLLLAFDTYEQTDSFLDSWLRAILQDEHGALPENVMLVIAGRKPLEANHWADYADMMAQIPLDPFTETEAKQYLSGKGITEPKVVEVIWQLSEGLPVLVATLASNSPQNLAEVGEPSGTAVERFLKWETDPRRRQVALDAALVRCLNRDLLTLLTDDADALFDWLKGMPFLEDTSEGWAYHDIVRTQMLRYKRRESPQSWAEIHDKLADYYDQQRQKLGLEADKQQTDPTWQNHTLNLLYHRLCQAPQKHLPIALNEFLLALDTSLKFSQQWGEVLAKAGRDIEANGLTTWGDRLTKGLVAYDEDRYEITLQLFFTLLNDIALGEKEQAIGFAWRGQTYRLMKRYEEALQDFNRAIELDSNYAWAIARRGEAYRLMKRYEEALLDFTHAIELDPGSDWAIASRGQTYQSMERYEEALLDFNRAIELDSNYAWAIARRGETYQSMERYEEALLDFNRAIELDSNSAWMIAWRGQTYRLMKRYEEALSDFNRSIELDPNYAWAIASRGETYRLMERYEEALLDFNRAIELDPNSAWAIASRGQTYQAMKRYEEALPDFNRAIELDPNSAWAIVSRGQTYRSMKRYEEALPDFNRAIELDPESGWYLYIRALVCQSLHQSDQAKTDITQAIQLAQQGYRKDPQDYRNTFNLAIYYLAAADHENAKRFYRDALDRGATASSIQGAIQDLEEFLDILPEHPLADLARQAKAFLERRLGEQTE